MIKILQKLFGFGTTTNFAELVKKGAVILDVRSKSELAALNIKYKQNCK